ncbi:porin family protein [Flavobacterium sp.]|uniref:porin family protein n=1 Tax=Flavobacterium sp. TaxID=239 RepID=UPI003750747F
MQKLFQIILFLSCLTVFSQEEPNFSAVDSLYREDQFYFGVTYNVLNLKPKDVSQNSFSTGLSLGFLRDFPINKDRTFAIAPGLGFSYNNYKENLVVDNLDGTINYSIIESGINYKKNKLALYFVDLPIEFRWRTSTFDSHKFWRVYTGFKLSYLILSQSRYLDATQNFKINNNPDINKMHYGAYISAGYNSWNLYAYYGLQNMFKNGSLNGNPIEISTLNIGLMFYVL